MSRLARACAGSGARTYLAGGLPVVSTRVPDAGVVHFAADGAGFARACREVVRPGLDGRDRRLCGPAVPVPAEAAVSSATPFLRAPLLGRISAALLLHSAPGGWCPTCVVEAPCPTAQALRW